MEQDYNFENVHTVQIEGKDVEVVVKSEAETFIGSVVETTKESITKEVEKKASDSVKREYSKKLGVNLFDDKDVEKFLTGDGDKVARSEYDALNAKLEEYKPIKDNYETLSKENNSLKMENAVITNNVNDKYKDKVIKLASIEMQTNDKLTPAEAVENIVKEFDMFRSPKQKWGLDYSGGPDDKTASEKYIADKYKDNPYYKKQ